MDPSANPPWSGRWMEGLPPRSHHLLRLMGVPHRHLAEFNGMLASAVERGVPLERALEVMASQGGPRGFRSVLEKVAGSLREGASLPDALSRHPRTFPREYPPLLEAGLEGGDLARVLRHAKIYHSMRARLSRGASRILAYGGACLLVCLFVLGILLFVWSQFMDPMQHMDTWWYWGWHRDLPLTWRLMLWLKADVYRLPLIALALMGLFWVVPPVLLKGFLSRTRLGYWVPAWGRIQKSRDLGLFCISMALRLDAGKTVPESLGLAAETVPTRYARKVLRKVRARVEEGEDLATALMLAPMIPKTLSWGVSVGEARGGLPEVFALFADLYTSQLEQSYDMLLTLLTPLGLLLVGNIVLLMATTVMTPFVMWW